MLVAALKVLVTGLLYYLAAWIGVNLTSLDSGIAIIWPPNAILLFALLFSPARLWPLLCAAAFIAELAADLPHFALLPSIFFGIINLSECVLITLLCNKLLAIEHSQFKLGDVKHVAIFSVSTLLVASPLAGLAGAATNYFLIGLDTGFLQLWQLWWFGDAIGIIMLVPLFLAVLGLVKHRVTRRVKAKHKNHLVVTLACLIMIWLILFVLVSEYSDMFTIAPMLLILPLVWLAYKFNEFICALSSALTCLANS